MRTTLDEIGPFRNFLERRRRVLLKPLRNRAAKIADREEVEVVFLLYETIAPLSITRCLMCAYTEVEKGGSVSINPAAYVKEELRAVTREVPRECVAS